jgi:signal transduction histidine kinase
MNLGSWNRWNWASRLFAMPEPEPVQQEARILSMQRNIVLPTRLVVSGIVLYYLFYARWLNELPESRAEVALATLQHYFIFYIVFNAIAAVLLILRRFPAHLVQWVVFTVGFLDGLLLAGLTIETGGFSSTLFWVFPGLIVLNAFSIPLATPQIVLNLALSAFYLGAGLVETSINENDMQLPPSVLTHGLQSGAAQAISADDFKDFAALAARLKAHTDPVSGYLWSRFSPGTRLRLGQYNGDPAQGRLLVASLTVDLNDVLTNVSIYDQSRFTNVVLSAETRAMIAQGVQGDRVSRLNRALIEDAYPLALRNKTHRSRNSTLGTFMKASEDAQSIDSDTGPEPFLLRLMILWLLTASCYGVQLLSFRDLQAQDDAREASARNAELKAAGRLAAEIAHQLKNPLGIINNAVFSLERGIRQGRQDMSGQFEIIREEIERADRIITQLMGYAQLSEGRVEKLDVRQEFDHAITEVFPPAANYTTRIHRDFGPALPPLVMQRIHLSAILVNLLQNAREAVQGRGNLFLSAHVQRDSAIEVVVADDGPGIPPDKTGKIFDPYYTSKSKGTGLGLAIVKHNVELYGGTVNLETKLGKGARFILLFPSRSFAQ